ncbi:hypothetical protein E4K10_47010 [Streptomyces sp. T1317-0309]|nr:hypothetical protein E4K10_47010 [Streptomyces sp. T1317-0309]
MALIGGSLLGQQWTACSAIVRAGAWASELPWGRWSGPDAELLDGWHRCRSWWWPLCAGFGLVSGVNGNTLTTQAALWAVSAFPAMAAAEVAVLAAVAAGSWPNAGRKGRP